jgi:MerR family transcriptional regulator/heat shock protein HspR
MAARFNEPLFVISVAARLVEMHPQTLRKYEKEGLIEPSRTSGNLRLYSDRDIERLRQVKYLVEGRGLNLAGVQLVLELTRRLRELRNHTEAMHQELARNGSGRHNGDAFAMIRDELDDVLRLLGYVEESQRDDDRFRTDRRDGRRILQ